jgi:hypothetical protein
MSKCAWHWDGDSSIVNDTFGAPGSTPPVWGSAGGDCFKSPTSRPDFTRMACFGDRFPGNPVVDSNVAINKCIEELNSAIQFCLMTSYPNHRPCGYVRRLVPSSIRREVHLKNRLKMYRQVTRYTTLQTQNLYFDISVVVVLQILLDQQPLHIFSKI